ncbi:MAG: hypothetical protein ABI895_29260 [Deltaproteobacteria bacterium]
MQRWTQRAVGLASLWLALTPSTDTRAATEVPEARASSSADGLVTLAQDLTLTVTEDGPNQPWTVTLANRGSEPLGFIADPGLLWFDVTLPGRATQSCRLPEPLRPSAMQRKSVLVLAPGEQYSRRLDPRFFCFAELGQILLVPRAKVTPHFGWLREPVATAKTKPRAPAKRSARAAPAPAAGADVAPFVAWRLTGPAANLFEPVPPPMQEMEGEAEALPSGAGADWRVPKEGLKAVQGATLELPDAYASWSGASPRGPRRELELVLLAGSDAEDERNATVTFGVLNTLDRPQQLFVRRELLDYDVQGPDGFFECPGSDVGTPDYASFSTLAPHGAERAMVRLIEVCPRRSFARPGLYEVRARLAARWSGQELGLDAFVGQLDTLRPAYVRVRSGDRSSFARLVVPPRGPPAAAAPGRAPEAEAPAEAAPDAPPNDDTPDNPNAPDDALPTTTEQPLLPAPEAPPVE